MMMLALSFPLVSTKLAALLSLAGGLAIIVAALKTRMMWERLFATGLGFFVLWDAYFAGTQGANSSDAYHSFVFFFFMTVSLGLLIASLRAAGDRRRMLTSAGLGLFVGRVWWEAVATACGRLAPCIDGLAEARVPDWIAVALVAAAIALLVRAAITAGEGPPARLIPAAVAASLVFNLYLAVHFAASTGSPFGRTASIIGLLGYGGGIGLSVGAAARRADGTTTAIGIGLALFMAPQAWNALAQLVSPGF